MAREPVAESPDLTVALLEAIRKLTPEQKRELLGDAGPTTQGMTPEMFQTIAATFASVSQNAVKNTLRMERAENPNYPEISAFNPRGVFDNQGTALAPKAKFTRPTFFNNIRLGGELEKEEEITLCNQIVTDRSCRDGLWKAEIFEKGSSRERLMITVPSLSIDERMNLPAFTLIVAELLGGPEAVNPLTMQKQIDELKAKLESMSVQTTAA